eukprot:1755476-Prymnesium_polylepis.1
MAAVGTGQSLQVKIANAKKNGDIAPVERHFERLADSLRGRRAMGSNGFGVSMAAHVQQLWRDVTEIDPENPMVAIFWLEYYLDAAQGRGLPTMWTDRMRDQARKSHRLWMQNRGSSGPQRGSQMDNSRPPPPETGE